MERAVRPSRIRPEAGPAVFANDAPERRTIQFLQERGYIMGISCLFGHKWKGCRCERCGSIRDEGHEFQPVPGKCQEKCGVCGKVRAAEHQWKGCKCERCGAVRDEGHEYRPVPGKCEEKCGVCGKTRETEHQWKGCKCERCGKTRNEGHKYEPVPGGEGKRCVYCGRRLVAFDLSEFDDLEKGAIDTVLTLFAETNARTANDPEVARMTADYKERLNKQGEFAYEELCNIGLAARFVLNSANPQNLSEQLLYAQIKKAYDKLENLIEKNKERVDR